MADDEPTEDAPRPRTRSKEGGSAPISAMSAEDRAMVTAIPRRVYEIIELTVDKLWAEISESQGVPKIPGATAKALLDLQKMAAGVIDKHPGLFNELEAQGKKPEATDEDLERVLAALEQPARSETDDDEV